MVTSATVRIRRACVSQFRTPPKHDKEAYIWHYGCGSDPARSLSARHRPARAVHAPASAAIRRADSPMPTGKAWFSSGAPLGG
jgi:hypothetical protein